ncbi:MAG: YraN family protein [Beggiatoa sp. IS2]|nr:MAG: YraN family protein [Beggiatoa sp. IS2]
MKRTKPSERGKWAEDLAYTYLSEQGLRLVTRNYRCQLGEIDLIMQHVTHLVFVEVRYRASQRYGGGLESIDYRKQQRLLLTATHYLQTHSEAQQYICRFDAVIISGQYPTAPLQWLIDAFQA